jgi:SAM-dependent methyltransferase
MLTTEERSSRALSVDQHFHRIGLLCWNCSAPLGHLEGAQDKDCSRVCGECQATTHCIAGIWRTLAPAEQESYKRFIAEYEHIRAAEGRGSDDSAYYLALPYTDLSGANGAQWGIRASTFRYIANQILRPRAMQVSRPLRILDLGAGNGWLSYRLRLMGHEPVAVDLLANMRDGLGAASHYAPAIASLFPRVQASLDRLPFPDSSFDLAIFNASFHYSEDCRRTLAEAMRCVRSAGAVLIADTPWYAEEESGIRMVEEKHRHFQKTYGFASSALSSLEFLTPSRLQQLESALRIKWQTHKPYYGMKWALRPVRAKLLKRRTPSRFHIYQAEVPA